MEVASQLGKSGSFPVTCGKNDSHQLPRGTYHSVLFVVLRMELRASPCKTSTLS